MVSLSEHAQIMKEMGITPSSGGTGAGRNAGGSSAATAAAETIKIQHVVVIPHSPKWEALIQRAVDGWLALGRHVVTQLVPSMKVFLMACSVSVVLYGTSHLIASFRTTGGATRPGAGGTTSDDTDNDDKKSSQ